MSEHDTTHQGSDVWEDLNVGYVPDDELDIHPRLSIHESYDEDIDPVTYEVLRHRLWTINEEHGRTLENVSGSPVAYFGQDFNPTILLEDGEVVFNGPYVQVFSPITELQTKWILENRSDNPGIEPGDVFLSNDPWIGSTHQPDVFFIAPVFHDGELFCWIANTLHQYDIGGQDAGSFSPGAEDVYDEPTPIPPIKVVEGGEVRQDLRQMYMRHSRLPNMVGLDFNAQVAGLQTTASLIEEVIEEYGPEVVKGSMQKIIEDSEASFLERLREIPDGTWRTRAYEEGATIGDDELYRSEIQLIKEGDTLTFRNEGTAENTGAINLTYAGFRTAISCVINPMLLHDQLWVTSGAYRHIDIETESGTLSRAEYPSGVSPGAVQNIQFVASQLYDVITRMLSTSDRSRGDLILDPMAGIIVMSQAGIDQWGNPYGTMNLDVMGLGFGSRATRDGIDVGGNIFSPKGKLPNIEQNEQDYPLLYLYREEATDGGGPGEYRGGAGLETAWIPHKTEQIQTVIAGTGGVTPNTRGIAAYPGSRVTAEMLADSDVETRLENGEIPQDLSEADGDLEVYGVKSELVQEAGEIVETRNGSTAGYGDPIQRDPERVLADVEKEVVSESAAEEYYGVVLTETDDGRAVDEAATAERRSEIVDERLAESTIPAETEV